VNLGVQQVEMKCPHCRVAFHDTEKFEYLAQDVDAHWASIYLVCPSCRKIIVFLRKGAGVGKGPQGYPVSVLGSVASTLVYPKGTARPPVPQEVPPDIAQDYTEACRVLTDSPKASAALSRRCLQATLRSAGAVKPGDLADEIQQVLDSGKLPSTLAESIDAIRNVGNFSAHPIKSKATGTVVPVEPHEAGWNLDVLEALFDYFFVQPAIIAKKRAALDAKLQDAGKPPMKQP
jgi:hypothetical protein